jgi:pimeloyl-ACP methyl ester carboxylesterase
MAYIGNSQLKLPEKIFTCPDGSAVYAGSVPPGASYGEKPVVVFVPGLGSHAKTFWNKNTMYENAYRSGYRTAYIEFNMPGKMSLNMWNNGESLAHMLSDICSHYHVPRVVIVAHSKGGVDSQTAAVFYGAANHIEKIITLSTPHFGSQLADFAYSSAGWAFAELIKAHSPGCFAMQTGSMREFRAMTDSNSNNITPIITFAGNGGADELTRMRVSSMLLDRFGENDGVVTVESAHNPNGEHLGTFHLNHAQMSNGQFIWAHLAPVLAGLQQEPVVAASASPFCAPPAQIIKGGRLEKGISESFYVDSTVEKFTVSIMIHGNPLKRSLMLISPDGRKTALSAKRDFDNVTVMRASVDNPKVGKWRLATQPGKGAYWCLICLHGKDIFCVCPKAAAPGQMEANLRILRTYPDGYDVFGEYNIKNGNELPTLQTLPKGIYNLEMHLSGELDDGSIFERSLVRPLASGSDLRELLKQGVNARNK